jgi:hypothetical protein
MMKTFRRVIVVAVCVTACSSNSTGGEGAVANGVDSPSTFVASVASFQNFHAWTALTPTAPNGVTDTIDTTHPRTVYITPRPPHGSTSFPIGTVIVKEFESGSTTDRRVLAMVKRGGGFNADGAVGWEWFELKNVDDTNVQIIWRGVAPPAGESYAPGSVTCNDCHGAAKGNDFVWTTGLALSAF